MVRNLPYTVRSPIVKASAFALSLAACATCGVFEAREAAAEEPKKVTALNLGEAMVNFLNETELSGFLSTSYLYNFSESEDAVGRAFDVKHNEFAINKFKLAFDNTVEASDTAWDAGYRADVILGQDATIIKSAGLDLGDDADLEQAFVRINVPVGNGIEVSAGTMVTLLGVEVIEETVNPNWSEGLQFLFVENFTTTGVQLAYKFTDSVDAQFRVFNGWDVTEDNNNALSYMGRVGAALSDSTSLALLGYFGPEQAENNSDYRSGGEIILNQKFCEKFNTYLQLDYGHEDGIDADWYGAGLWAIYTATDTWGIAARADLVDDDDGARTSGLLGFPELTEGGQTLYSFTLTLNLTPVEKLQIRPEVRFDFSDEDTYFDDDNQITGGVNIAKLF